MSDSRQNLTKQMSSILQQVEALNQKYVGEDMPAEVSEKISELLGQTDVLKTQIEHFDRLKVGHQFLEESQGAAALHHGWRQASPSEGELPNDPKSWRELEVKMGPHSFPVRYNVPLAVQKKDYPEAFEEYMRKGFSNMRPGGQKTLLEGQDSAGGFTVPEDYQTQLIRKVATSTAFRMFARIVTTSRDSVKWPKIKYASDDQYTSGVRLTWTGESPTSSTVHRVTDPVFGLVNIPVHTAMASLPLSMDVMEDSAFNLEALSAELLGEAFGLGENNVFWNGSGAGQPLGIVTNVDETEGVASVVSGDASTLTADGLIDLIYALPAQYEPGSRVFWNKATEKVVRKMKVDGSTTEYVWPVEERVGGFGNPERTILGFPITRDEFIPDIAGNAFPIFFGQLSGYFIVDRVGLSFQRLDQVYAEQNVIVILARKRVGGQVVEPWRLRAQKIST